MKRIVVTILLLLNVLMLQAQNAEGIESLAFLNGEQEVPPNSSRYVGTARFSLDGSLLSCSIDVPFGFLGISPALYGPAKPGENGPLIFSLTNFFITPPWNGQGGGRQIYGTFTLTPSQIEELANDLWYVDFQPPEIAIRGQILLDSDLDRVPDSQDACPNTPAGAIINSSGCGINQLCPCEGPWKNHADYLTCLRATTASFVNNGLITPAAARTILKHAHASSCGRR